MKFIVGEQVEDEFFPNAYVLEIRVMHGDADQYESLVFAYDGTTYEDDTFVDQEELEEKLDLLARMKAAFPNGRGGDYDRYSYSKNVSGFNDLFEEEWPWDVTGGEIEATYDSHRLFFIDSEQVKHHVTVE